LGGAGRIAFINSMLARSGLGVVHVDPRAKKEIMSEIVPVPAEEELDPGQSGHVLICLACNKPIRGESCHHATLPSLREASL